MPDPSLAGYALPPLTPFGQVNSAVAPPPEPIPGDSSQDLPPDPGLMSRIGNFVSLPGYAVRNLMLGNTEGAFHNATDFLGDIPSAIPGVGGFIPTLSTQADKPSFSDVTGGMEPGFGRSALNFVGDTLTDPLSYIPGSWVSKGLGVAGAGIGTGMSALDKVAPEASQLIRSGYYGAKGALGYLASKVPGTQAALDAGKSVGLTEGEASATALPQIPHIADPVLGPLAHDLTNNIYHDADGVAREIMPSVAPATEAAMPEVAEDAAAAMAGKAPEPMPAAPAPQTSDLRAASSTDVQGIIDSQANGDAAVAAKVFPEAPNPLQEMRRHINAGTLEDTMSDRGFPAGSPEYQSVFHAGYDDQSLQEMKQALNAPETALNAKDLGESIAAHILPAIQANRTLAAGGELSMREQTALAVMNAASKRAKQVGINPQDMLPHLGPYLGELGFKAGDADLFSQFVRPGARPVAPPEVIPPAPVHSVPLPIFAKAPKTDLQIAQEAAATADKAAAEGVDEPLAQTFVTKPQQMALHDARLDRLRELGVITAEQQGKLRELLDAQTDFAQAMWKNEVERKVMTNPMDLKGAGAGKSGNPDLFPVDYSPRRYTDALSPEERAALGAIDMKPTGVGSGGESATAARSIGTGQAYADYLNKAKEAGITPNRNLAENWMTRAAAHGNLTGKAAIAQGILGDKFVSLADKATNGAMQEAMVNMAKADPEGAILLKNQFFGMGPRHPAMQVLNKLAAPFKKSAVYGILFPQVGHIVRNILSHPFQYAAQGHTKMGINQALRTPGTIWHALQIGIHKTFGFQLPYDKISGMIKARDAAMAQAGGSALKAAEILRSQGMGDVALALEHGVGQGFVSQEVLQDQLGKSSWGRRMMAAVGVGKPMQDRIVNQMNVPEEAFRGEEQYARFGGFMDQLQHYRAQGDLDAAAKAAKDVRDSLYDYTPQTAANRTLRTLIPFAAFQTNAIRQTTGAMLRNPWLATAVGQATQQDPNSPKYPYMEGKTNIPIGLDEKGNPQYISQVGLPMEAMNSIPNPSAGLRNFGDLAESGIVGSMNPLIKTAYEVLAGHDPYFKTPMGSYDKVPLLGHAGGFGQAYNTLEGTGLIQPLTSPLTQLQHLTDERHDLGTRLLNTFTGANVVSVDPKIAEQQVLSKALSLDPNVAQYIRFQPTQGDTEAKGLINRLSQTRKEVAAEKKPTPASTDTAAKPANPNQRFPKARPPAGSSSKKEAAKPPEQAAALPLQ